MKVLHLQCFEHGNTVKILNGYPALPPLLYYVFGTIMYSVVYYSIFEQDLIKKAGMLSLSTIDIKALPGSLSHH